MDVICRVLVSSGKAVYGERKRNQKNTVKTRINLPMKSKIKSHEARPESKKSPSSTDDASISDRQILLYHESQQSSFNFQLIFIAIPAIRREREKKRPESRFIPFSL